MSTDSKRILWIDDEIEYLRSHILYLEEHDYVVVKATNGDDGLVLIRSQAFDIVLLDEQMPGKDGLTTLEEIREYDSNLPVVMVTKSEEERLMEAALGRNISGYLIKPVNPSQILSVCKTLLHSRSIRNTHATTSYVREYSDIKSNLLSTPTPSKWGKIHYIVSRWDVEMPLISDKGLEEMHKTNKKDLARQFIRFVEENYVNWVGKKGGNPDLHTQTLRRKVIPILKKEGSCVLIIMAGFRLDQWLALQKLVEPFFQVETNLAWALLPTEKSICQAALFSGQLPRDVSLNQPQLWQRYLEEEDKTPCERELLKTHLRTQGVDIEDPRIIHLRTQEDNEQLAAELDKHAEAPLLVVVVEFLEMLTALRLEVPLIKEIVPDEKGVRELTMNWFRSSRLFEALQTLSSRKRTVVLTSDHGTVRVDAPAEVFCQEEMTPHPRVKSGSNLSCDERHALFVESPSQFGLPGETGKLAYTIAKGNYYFVYPNKFQYIITQFKDQMVSGGLSMEEMIVPVVTLTPK